VLSVLWDNTSFFCINKKKTKGGVCYHIKCYQVDQQGLVKRAFSLGREWHGVDNLQGLLSQWNYWSMYMNRGPSGLPLPALFFMEKESIQESFLFCLYDLGSNSAASRIVNMPFIIFMTLLRIATLATCRDPIWPDKVLLNSAISESDEFNQPRGKTPVGWSDTALSRARNEYPFDPKCLLLDWDGEENERINASMWAQDIPKNR